MRKTARLVGCVLATWAAGGTARAQAPDFAKIESRITRVAGTRWAAAS